MSDAPVLMRWHGFAKGPGGAFQPLPNFAARCDELYVDNEIYAITARQPRSPKSHSHYFACVTKGWKNLPEDLAKRYPSPDHLRKQILIEAGFVDERTRVEDTPAGARAVASYMKTLEPHTIIVVSGNVIKIFTARSQKGTVMGAKEFQESKDVVLNKIADMLGISVEELTKVPTKQESDDE
jgi:hypothetical protein